MTVSIGEETRGVLREMRFVTGVSRATSEAGKPSIDGYKMLELNCKHGSYQYSLEE